MNNSEQSTKEKLPHALRMILELDGDPDMREFVDVLIATAVREAKKELIQKIMRKNLEAMEYGSEVVDGLILANQNTLEQLDTQEKR